MDNTDIVFQLPSGGGGADAIAVENQPVPAGGNLGDYRVPFRPQITPDGSRVLFFSSTIPPASTGSSSGAAILTDGGSTSVAQFIFGVPGSTTDVHGRAIDLIDSDFEASSDGSLFVTKVGLAGLPSAGDDVILLADLGTGTVTTATSSGVEIVEGGAIPGVADAVWDNFNRFAIIDDGTFLFTGDYDDNSGATTDTIDFLSINGDLTLVEGQTLADGGVLGEGFDSAELSEAGDYATIAEVDSANSLIVNGDVVFTLRDAVLFDGELTELTSFNTGADQLGIVNDGDGDGVFDVFFSGSTLAGDGSFSITVPEPASALLLAAGGALLARRRRLS